jgi:hypothetical protein
MNENEKVSRKDFRLKSQKYYKLFVFVRARHGKGCRTFDLFYFLCFSFQKLRHIPRFFFLFLRYNFQATAFLLMEFLLKVNIPSCRCCFREQNRIESRLLVIRVVLRLETKIYPCKKREPIKK